MAVQGSSRRQSSPIRRFLFSSLTSFTAPLLFFTDRCQMFTKNGDRGQGIVIVEEQQIRRAVPSLHSSGGQSPAQAGDHFNPALIGQMT